MPRPSRPPSLAAALLALALASCAVRSGELRETAPAPPVPASGWKHGWARGAVFYEVFVRSFSDSNGDGIGDVNGLIGKLDYLADLGVDALWLMPMFKSPSYHGYDTTDYETLNPDYGTNADFERLLQEAHRRNIRIIVDLVANHTSAQHPWFVEASTSPDAPRRDWYSWRKDDPGWTQPWGGNNHTWHEKGGAYFYGIFWGGMPDLNFRSAAVRAEVKRLASLWLQRGVDGFRLDAARHLIETGPAQGQCDSAETHAFWKEFAAYVRSVKPEAILVGENWTETPIIATYYGSAARDPAGDELPMNFNFPLADQILTSVTLGDPSGIAAKLEEMAGAYPPGIIDAPFLTNHDHIRVATKLGNDAQKLKSAAAILLTLPGAPFVYYGEEIGLQNAAGQKDEAKRTPMPWDGSPSGAFTTGKPWFDFAPGRETANVATQVKEPGSLLQRYRSLLHLRRALTALKEGTLKVLSPAGATPSPLLAFVREGGGERVLVVHNLGDREAATPLALPAAGFEKLFADPGAEDPAGSAGAWRVSLPAHATGIWRLR